MDQSAVTTAPTTSAWAAMASMVLAAASNIRMVWSPAGSSRQWRYGHTAVALQQPCATILLARDAIVRGRLTIENPVENGVDVLEVIAEIEFVLDFGCRKRSGHFRIGLQQLEQGQRAVGFPHFHRVALHQPV